MTEKKTVLYFSTPGEKNTDETLKMAKVRAEELEIRDILVASTRGITALKTIEVFKGFNVYVISHVTGWQQSGIQQLTEENAIKIKAKGGKIVTSAHTFSGVNTAIQTEFDTMYPAGIIERTLKLLGEGMKVVVEIAAMATDAGVISPGKDVIAIAGSSKGADTAVVLEPANSRKIFDIKIREIITKPTYF
jgi:hypothetical protein